MIRMKTTFLIIGTVMALQLRGSHEAYAQLCNCSLFEATVSIGKSAPPGSDELLYIQGTTTANAAISFNDSAQTLLGIRCHVRADLGVGDYLSDLADEHDFVIRHSESGILTHECGGDIILTNKARFGRIRFATSDDSTGAERERMRIDGSGFVKIGDPIIPPATMLHIGDSTELYFPAGNTMKYGTLSSADSHYVYSGLHSFEEAGKSHYDAIIAWGDNLANQDEFGTDAADLHFVYNYTDSCPLQPQTVMRLTSDTVFIGVPEPVDRTMLAVNGNVVTHSSTATLGTSSHPWQVAFTDYGVVELGDSTLIVGPEDIPYGLEHVMDLRPARYLLNGFEQHDRRLGFIAQEVQGLIAEAVHVPEDQDHPLGIRYSGLIPVLVRAIQQQQAIISEGEELLQSLQDDVAELQQIISSQSVQISDLQRSAHALRTAQHSAVQAPDKAPDHNVLTHSFFLMPSRPNPVSETAALTLYLSTAVRTASVVLYNSADGREVRRRQIEQRGRLSLDIPVADLPAGAYAAVLICDDAAVVSTLLRILR